MQKCSAEGFIISGKRTEEITELFLLFSLYLRLELSSLFLLESQYYKNKQEQRRKTEYGDFNFRESKNY